MEKEKVYQYKETRRARTIEEIVWECLSKEGNSFRCLDWKERERNRIMVLAVVNKAPAAKKEATTKKVAPAKKAKGKAVEVEEEEEEEEFVKVLTKKERDILTKAARKEEVRLSTLPPPPYTSFQLGIKLGDYNPKELCSLWNDKSPRIAGVTQLSACSPTCAALDLISAALGPLADKPGTKISSTDKSTRDTLYKQLHDGINQNAASCLSLANGNLPVFNITTYRIKSKAVYFKGQLPAHNFDLSTNKGPGKVRVKTKKNKYAINYTVYHGVGDYDAETWSFQVGPSDQIVEGTPGVLENFIIVANGSEEEGVWPDPQPKRFPFN